MMQSRGADGSTGRRAAAAEEGVTTGGRPAAEGGATGARTARAGRGQAAGDERTATRRKRGQRGRRRPAETEMTTS